MTIETEDVVGRRIEAIIRELDAHGDRDDADAIRTLSERIDVQREALELVQRQSRTNDCSLGAFALALAEIDRIATASLTKEAGIHGEGRDG